MRALVTGGAGFIGSHLVDQLLAAGHHVVVLDHLSTGRIENIAHHLGDPRFRFVNDSILNAAVVDRLVESCDVVFHLAAMVGVWYIVRDPLQAIVTNVEGTETVLRAAFRHWKRVVLASSSEVYGKSTRAPLAEDDDRVLGPTTVARWSYSSSKAIDEHFAYAYAARGLPVVILRFFNAYGPRIHENGYGTVVARFIRQALAGQPLTVHGDGRQTRCFCYVDDTVRGILLAAEVKEAEGRVFNIGNDAEISIRALAERIRDLTGSSSEIVFVPYEDYYGQKFEDTPRRVPDLRRARTVLGYAPQVSLEEGLRRTIAWCRSNGFLQAAASEAVAGVRP
ncbi:MAG: GDP-mannose 4,6-dehydratase [Armatimonadota bacterium]|nr:GDP-mannose 4,6-dehydratase [Armatimonadota bacterium]